MEVLKWYIQYKPSFAYLKNKAGVTPFFFAAQEGRLNILQFLLSQEGVNPNEQANDGSTPLHWACKAGQLKTVEWLLETAKVEKNAVDNEGSSALTLALKYNHKDLIEMLIKEGADFRSVEFLYYAVLHPNQINVSRLASFIEELPPDSIDSPHSHYGFFYYKKNILKKKKFM